jgi:hypothetical protein
MRKLALAFAATTALEFAIPTFAADAPRAGRRHDGDHGSKKVVLRHGESHHGIERREVRMHRDHGRHAGWRHSHHGGKKTVIIKPSHGKTVIKKKFES